MEFKGTEGEWKDFHIQLKDWSTCAVGVDKQQAICTMYYEGTVIPEKTKADAKLIAGSKNLLNTLLKAREILMKEWPLEEWIEFDNEIKFTESIEKALGENKAKTETDQIETE